MISAELAVGIVGNVIALILFLYPVPTFIQILKKGSVEQFSPVPYLATFINCGIWVLYGLPMVHPHSLLVITINATGFVIEGVYLTLFLIYSDRKKRLRVFLLMVVEILFLGVLATLVLTVVHTTKRPIIVGFIAMAVNIMMYAATLNIMKLVIRTESVEFMPFFLSLFSLLNGISWTIYALIRFDPYIAIPNGLGSLLGVAQLFLYGVYWKSTKRQIAERKATAELGVSGRSLSRQNSIRIQHKVSVVQLERAVSSYWVIVILVPIVMGIWAGVPEVKDLFAAANNDITPKGADPKIKEVNWEQGRFKLIAFYGTTGYIFVFLAKVFMRGIIFQCCLFFGTLSEVLILLSVAIKTKNTEIFYGVTIPVSILITGGITVCEFLQIKGIKPDPLINGFSRYLEKLLKKVNLAPQQPLLPVTQKRSHEEVHSQVELTTRKTSDDIPLQRYAGPDSAARRSVRNEGFRRKIKG